MVYRILRALYTFRQPVRGLNNTCPTAT
ncbi:hypothetical protein E2C01_051837 [Portunus trituberculatus]|uniref:Uncharacterized protein n=1 Tax=Portunus trituberculatus TaxID=210409 RepID=A0A5B7GLJ1_PORTR|nr:hypothetical protein [Portunus trituberculatus]